MLTKITVLYIILLPLCSLKLPNLFKIYTVFAFDMLKIQQQNPSGPLELFMKKVRKVQ